MPNPSPDPRRDAPRLVYVTAPDAETAERLARGLLERRLAACVQIVPGVRSLYRWRGAIEESAELQLQIKTSAGQVRDVEAWITAEHPYDCPECVALEPRSTEAGFLAWWVGALRSEDGGA